MNIIVVIPNIIIAIVIIYEEASPPTLLTVGRAGGMGASGFAACHTSGVNRGQYLRRVV